MWGGGGGCVRACVHACVRACVRACVCVCVSVCARVCFVWHKFVSVQDSIYTLGKAHLRSPHLSRKFPQRCL